MIGACGMGSSLISLQAVSGLHLDDLVGRVLADPHAREELSTLLDTHKAHVVSCAMHRHLALRDALLERHELVGDEILDVLEQAGGRPSAEATGCALLFALSGR